jgi:hypothetical protein
VVRGLPIIVAGSLALAACASGPAPRTGFLGDYSELTRVRDSDSIIAQSPPPGFDVSRYDAVFIEPSVIELDELGEEDRQQLSAAFREALAERVGPSMRVVDRSGPRVLRVRSAIVGARKANVALNVVTSLLAAPLSRGGVAAEAEVLDGATGRRIAALSWSRRGARLDQVGLSYTRLGEARAGLRAFAGRLADLFVPANAGDTGSR